MVSAATAAMGYAGRGGYVRTVIRDFHEPPIDRPLVTAHQATSASAPGNTLDAFRAAGRTARAPGNDYQRPRAGAGGLCLIIRIERRDGHGRDPLVAPRETKAVRARRLD